MRLRTPDGTEARPAGVLFDLLMAVMNSLATWKAAAGDASASLAWRDAATSRMVATRSYAPYGELVADAARATGLPPQATDRLREHWAEMAPWPDAAVIRGLSIPYGFVTNCSAELARVAAQRSGLRPIVTLSAEEAGWYKPDPRAYREGVNRLGTPIERTAFVAGSPYDAAGAHAAGLRTWLVVRREGRPPPEGVTVVSTLVDAIRDIDPGAVARS